MLIITRYGFKHRAFVFILHALYTCVIFAHLINARGLISENDLGAF